MLFFVFLFVLGQLQMQMVHLSIDASVLINLFAFHPFFKKKMKFLISRRNSIRHAKQAEL